jgi:hypothetical protein
MNEVTTTESRDVSIGLTSKDSFELIQRAATMMSKSTLVPTTYQNNISNCIIALNMAARIQADPLMVMQNLIIVQGRPTFSASFAIASVNACGRFSALRYEFFGEKGTDEWGCRAWAIERATGEKLIGADVTIGLAKAEGWYGKNGSKWKTMQQQMLMYRASSWWQRAYAPEITMGLHTDDEIRDIIDITHDGNIVDDQKSFFNGIKVVDEIQKETTKKKEKAAPKPTPAQDLDHPNDLDDCFGPAEIIPVDDNTSRIKALVALAAEMGINQSEIKRAHDVVNLTDIAPDDLDTWLKLKIDLRNAQ